MKHLLDDVKARGLLVNNWFQHDSGRWQANLRTPDHRWADFGHGDTAEEAMRAALEKAKLKWPAQTVEDIFG